MKSIEHYIREKLNLPDAPAEVDANDLWESIETNLPPTRKRPKALWPWKHLFFTLLFVVISLVGGWFLLYKPELPTPKVSPNAEIAAAPAQTQTTTKAPRPQDNNISDTYSEREALTTNAQKSGLSGKNNSEKKTAQQVQALPKTSPAPASATKNKTLRTLPESTPSPKEEGDSQETLPEQRIALQNTRLPIPDTEAPLANNEKKSGKAKDIKTEQPQESLYTQSKTQQQAEAISASITPEDNTKNTDDEKSIGLTGEGKAISDRSPIVQETGKRSPEPSTVLVATSKLPTFKLRPLSVPPLALRPSAVTGTSIKTPRLRSTVPDRLSLGVNVGTSLLFTNYNSSRDGTEQALNAAVKPAAGSSFGLNLRYSINKNIALSTGLEYHRTLNTFEHTIEQDTTIEHPSPFNSGPIRAIRRHRIADNLRTRFFTVPVLIHWTQSRGSFNFGIGAGVGLNFRQFANGTTLSPTGDFVSFDATTGPSPTPKFFTSYRLSPSVAYRLKPKSQLSLQAKADFSYLPFGADELSGLQRNSFISGLSIGLRYGF